MGTTSKRSSYSIHHIKSARYGHHINLRDRLHVLLLIRADTTSGIAAYSLYCPTFTYMARGKETVAAFTVAARFANETLELWDSTWEHEPDPNSPLHLAQVTHAQGLGGVHRLYTVAELEACRTTVKNRATMHAILAAGYDTDTTQIAARIVDVLRERAVSSIAALAVAVGASLALTQLATFRLIVAGQAQSECGKQLIGPDWQVRSSSYVYP